MYRQSHLDLTMSKIMKLLNTPFLLRIFLVQVQATPKDEVSPYPH